MPKGTRRLILCGICFKPDCPWSKWVDEDGSEEVLDIIRDEYFGRIHSDAQIVASTQITLEEKRERIAEAIEEASFDAGVPVEIDNLEALLNASVSAERETSETVIERDLSVDDILKKYSEHLPNEKGGENDATKQH